MSRTLAATAPSEQPDDGETIVDGFAWRLFQFLAVIAALSVAIHIAGRMLGSRIANGGHSTSAEIHEIVIGNDVLAVPANMLRFERQRMSGVQQRADLYMVYPAMAGYADRYKPLFNDMSGAGPLIFVSFEERQMSRDMSGRLAPIYNSLIERSASISEAGLAGHRFRAETGYVDEVLFIGPQDAGTDYRYVARCLDGMQAKTSAMACERDIHLGENLTMVYRFPRHLLADWRRLDASVTVLAKKILRTAD
jgi:hypothetical protein